MRRRPPASLQVFVRTELSFRSFKEVSTFDVGMTQALGSDRLGSLLIVIQLCEGKARDSKPNRSYGTAYSSFQFWHQALIWLIPRLVMLSMWFPALLVVLVVPALAVPPIGQTSYRLKATFSLPYADIVCNHAPTYNGGDPKP